MTHYRISINPSKMWQRLQIAFYGLLILSVWCWQPHIISYQWLLQIALSLGIMLLLYQQLQQLAFTSVVSLSTEGQWLDLSQQRAFNITRASRVTPWLLWIQLQSSVSSQRQWCWICRDAVSDDDYRRLARIIYRVQQGTLNVSI
ncbi:protein YgfX [Alteromonadaceae bacterium BrNp21-10]|nr:protein YgfX [Alteromonadaceae bacterium BrNp21-10]